MRSCRFCICLSGYKKEDYFVSEVVRLIKLHKYKILQNYYDEFFHVRIIVIRSFWPMKVHDVAFQIGIADSDIVGIPFGSKLW